MIDYARITVIAGCGGDGSGSFTHIKGKRRGKADGGDGGRGGNVYLMASFDLNTLEPFRYLKEYRAKNGGNGASRRRVGAEGDDLVIKVPVGTVVKVESEKLKIESYDLVEEGQKVLVAKGGDGGRGNSHLRDEYGRRPYVGEKGEEGEELHWVLELKLIADVGLIGLPNAGKSTLLTALTSARPKVAPYPFTTLEPNLGVLQVSRYMGKWVDRKRRKPTNLPTYKPKNLIMADIPGLIEGASKGRGLGDLFLRHIERTKVLVHIIDVSQVLQVAQVSNEEAIWRTYQTIRGELKTYSKELAKKREVIVLNKTDLVNKETVSKALSFFKKKRKKVAAISAVTGEGLRELVQELFNR